MARPTWSGYIQISLVSFRVKLFPASNPASHISFHEIDRKSGERVRHQNVVGDDKPVDRGEIVKGFEYRKGKYLTLEPEEIKKLRIPSKDTLVIDQFVKVEEIDPALFEEPYFVVPDGDLQMKPFGVIRRALQETQEAGIGKVTFAGREHLAAIMPPAGKDSTGLMAYTLRFPAELRKASEYFSSIRDESANADQLALAKELIRRNTEKFSRIKVSDDYEVALHELVEAKLKHKPIPEEERAKPAKVINLMDALRQSIASRTAKTPREHPKHAAGRRSGTARSKGRGIALVKSASHGRKSA